MTSALAAAALLLVGPASGEQTPHHEPPAHRFLGPDGEPLPLASDAEILEFLREARVISNEPAPGGISGARKLLLEHDAVQAHAVFRVVSIEKPYHELSHGEIQLYFRDHYANEVAAYALSTLLQLPTVPPAVLRRLENRDGSLQLWIEGAVTEKELKEHKLPLQEYVKHHLQLNVMHVFDNLINNIDRNLGNFLTDVNGRVWYVDHTRSFSRNPRLPTPERVERCDEGLWMRLRELPDERFVAALSPYLRPPEIEALLERRRRVVSLLQERLESAPREQILLSLEQAVPGTRTGPPRPPGR